MLGSGGRRENPKGSVRPARTGAQTSLSDRGAKELDLGAEDPEKGGFGLNVLLHPRASSGLSTPFPLSQPANCPHSGVAHDSAGNGRYFNVARMATAEKSKIPTSRADDRCRTGGFLMPLTGLAVDEGPHNMDGLLLHAWEGSERVEAFISRPVMDRWVDPREPDRGRRSLLRAQYDALGKFNLPAIERIVCSKYQRGAAFNRQHPFVDILLSDIMESEEALDTSELVREPPPLSFQRMSR
jgi:hypothetical protein